jgi:ComF family protein
MLPPALRRVVVAGLHRLVSLALPPRCPGCGVPVGEDHRFCAGCWGALRFIGPPWCAGCNLPFAHDRGEGARCVACLAEPPHHAGVRAAVAYGPVARRLALRLKYGGRIGLATTMARAMAARMPAATDLLVPVPLHRWRLWRRGYNQAMLIAAALGRAGGVPVAGDALVRTRPTVPLRGMGSRQRRAAVRGAFAIRADAAVRGRAVVLVDDVYTSGATADACTRVLLRAGARSVTILCWARVLRGEETESG